jgi:hypothetical protein
MVGRAEVRIPVAFMLIEHYEALLGQIELVETQSRHVKLERDRERQETDSKKTLSSEL